MMTDNQGLLTRVEKSLPYPDPFPNNTLLANWDITNQITETLCKSATIPTFRHVKGHQDDKLPYHALNLGDAQLNIDANVEAGKFQVLYPTDQPIIP
jgi:hypothetical protein